MTLAKEIKSIETEFNKHLLKVYPGRKTSYSGSLAASFYYCFSKFIFLDDTTRLELNELDEI